MAGTGGYIRKTIFLIVGFLVMVLCFSANSKAQVTIKENLNIKLQERNSPKRQSLSKENFGTQSYYYWKWYQHVFKPQKDGELKISLVNAESRYPQFDY